MSMDIDSGQVKRRILFNYAYPRKKAHLMTAKEKVKSIAKEFVWFATSIHARDSITDNIVQLFHALEKNDLFDCIMEAPLFDTSTLRFLLELIDDLLSDFTQSPQYANVSSKDIQTYFNLLIQIRYHVATFLF